MAASRIDFEALRAAVGPDTRFWRAPGRVNLIGDHTDYQGGLCLPIAIDREVVVAYHPRNDARVVVRSLDLGGTIDVDARGGDDPALVEPHWGRTVAAAVRVLAARGRPPVGLEAAVASTVPLGSGLSSSAAFEVAIAGTLADAAQWPIAGLDLALAAQEAEHVGTGMPCGIMDQLASVSGRAGHALRLDCRALTVDPVALPESLGIVVVHSGLPRSLESSAYAERRRACEAAAARLGVATLRDATIAQVADDPIARHVVSENARVGEFVVALHFADLDALGPITAESHRSLAADFRVSTPELDALVAIAMDCGAYGARLTGAGFGGCVVVLVAAEGSAPVVRSIVDRYRARTRLEPVAFPVHAVDGAGLVTTIRDLWEHAMPSLFTRIIDGEIPGRFVWKDDDCVAFLTIEPMRPGHTLVVPRKEVDHWIDLDPELCAHVFEVARIIGRAQCAAFNPRRVGVLLVGDEVPHAHVHLVPIDNAGQLSFANIDRTPEAGALDAAAEAIRERLRAMGRTEVAD